METIRIVLLFFELLAFLLSLCFFQNYKVQLKGAIIIPIYLGIIFFSEFTSWLCLYKFIPIRNTIIANFQIPLEVIFFSLVYGFNFKSRNETIVTQVFFCIYLISFFLESLYFQDLYTRFNMISIMIGSLSIAILSFLYLLQSAKEYTEVHILRKMINWMSLGAFIAYTVDILIFSLSNFYSKFNTEEVDIFYIMSSIRLLAMILLYGLFCCGFIHARWKKTNY